MCTLAGVGILLFKYFFIIPMLLHFFRGCFLSSSYGFVHAQNDLIVITIAYPMLLVLIWC